MSHFNFEITLADLTCMDAPIQKGPLMRWQRKAEEFNLKVNTNIDHGSRMSPSKPCSAVKTPRSGRLTPITPGMTPGKTNGFMCKTPKKTPAKTPNKGQTDRFIPNRSTTNVDFSHHAVTTENDENNPMEAPYRHQLTEALTQGQNPKESKILSFKQMQPPQTREGHMNNLKVLYSSGKCSAPKITPMRHIPQHPEKILDAPMIMDDYYLNLMDWSRANNRLAVVLGNSLYIWNADNQTISHLFEYENEDDYISSVSWLHDGLGLAVGNSNGEVQIWDVERQKVIRCMSGHASRVGCLSLYYYVLSSGCRSGSIHHHDIRVANHHIGTLVNHTQEVCGLSWADDGRYLASGGNDNMLNIWDGHMIMTSAANPVHALTRHQAAVKALAWCPWQSYVLASGGGTADRQVCFWNAETGECLKATDTNSQICSILWSTEYKELISGHGYSHNQLILWKYPSMSKVAELRGHTARVLHMSLSPDGTTVASIAADETLCLWKCFASDKSKKNGSSKSGTGTKGHSIMSRSSIR